MPPEPREIEGERIWSGRIVVGWDMRIGVWVRGDWCGAWEYELPEIMLDGWLECIDCRLLDPWWPDGSGCVTGGSVSPRLLVGGNGSGFS